MDPLASGPSQNQPKVSGIVGRSDFWLYNIERSICWIALLTMAVTYFLDIVEREVTAGPGQNAVERFILDRMGQTTESADPAFLETLHTLYAPIIVVIAALALVLIAGLTARVYAPGIEGFTRLAGADRWRYWGGSLLGMTLFLGAVIYVPSTWLCAAMVLACFAWGMFKAKQNNSLRQTALMWVPATAAILWFVFACIETEYNWAKDLAKVLLMWVGFVGASMATYENRNIQVDFVRKSVPKAWLRYYEMIGSLATAAFTATLAALAYDTVRRGFADPVLLPNIELAEYFIPLPILLAFGVVVFRYLLRAFRLVTGNEVLADGDAPDAPNRFFIVAGIIVGLMVLSVVSLSGPAAGLITILLTLILLGAPLFVVIGGVALGCFAMWPQVADYMGSYELFSQNFNLMARMRDLADQEALIAIPFFMVAGAIMSRGAIAKQLVECARAAFGWLPGGLAISSVAACMFFAAISGSSPVTVITIGAIMLPALLEAGYPKSFSLGLVTSAGSLGIIIPPSIPMIIYAIFATLNGTPVDIKDLFIAGIGPGLVIGGSLAIICMFKGASLPRTPFNLQRVTQSLRDGFWALFLPVFILVGIYFGIFNAIEASAIAVVLALYIELFIHRELKVSELPAILSESASLMGSILVIISVALGLSEFFTVRQIPDLLVNWLASYELSPLGFVLMLNVMLIIVGCLMDIISALILFVPLIVPLGNQLGIDPIHLGLIFIVNLEIGYLTPPLGLNLFVASGFFQVPFGEVMKSVLPFIAALMVSLVVITAVPTISLGPVNYMYDRPVYTPFPSGKVLKPKTKKDMDSAPSSFIAATSATSDGESDDGAKDNVDLGKITDMSRVTEAEGTGDVEDFDPSDARAYAVMSDGKHTTTVVLLTNESSNCGDPSADKDDEEWLLRLEFPAGAKEKTSFVLGKSPLKASLVRYEEGKEVERQDPTGGLVVILSPEYGEKISVTDPKDEGATIGLFGAFELNFGDDTLNGKFVPSPCNEGQLLYR